MDFFDFTSLSTIELIRVLAHIEANPAKVVALESEISHEEVAAIATINIIEELQRRTLRNPVVQKMLADGRDIHAVSATTH